MAYAKTVHYNHLVCWNIKGEGAAQDRKKTVSTYLSALTPSADILFLQEVQWVPSNLKSHLSALGDHYELSYYSQEYSNCYNCVIFDKRKFEALPTELTTPLSNSFKLLDKQNEWEKKGFRASQEKQMRNRMCVVALRAKSEGRKFITASLHNVNNKEYSIKMAELFLKLLALVGEITGYPVVLAGDFNANVQKSPEVARLGYVIPEYKPTLHRLHHKSPIDVTIDFFLYRRGKDGCPMLHNMKAELARGDVVDSKGTVNVKKMDELHKVSNHDPLRAILQLPGASKISPIKPPAAAAVAASKRPPSSSSGSKTVIKSSIKSSPPPATAAISKTSASPRVKRDSTTLPKPKSAPPARATVVKGTTKPMPTSVKPSASHTVIKSRASNPPAKTKRSIK